MACVLHGQGIAEPGATPRDMHQRLLFGGKGRLDADRAAGNAVDAAGVVSGEAQERARLCQQNLAPTKDFGANLRRALGQPAGFQE